MIELRSRYTLSKINEWAARIGGLGPQVIDKASQEAASAALGLVWRGFAFRRSPWGVRWKQTKTGGSLVRTGRLKSSFYGLGRRGLVEVGNPTPYASFHQTGTARMPARRTLPSGIKIPPKWRAAIGAAVFRAFSPFLREER